ncbi:NAD(P)/FAD-dependent oxidoreductase [Hydrogenoanaerobacterium sp.]|uniref:NAD(P)/FAD-dependent oxidoreductase n=1 Tax=Hydrogenoanaerobacterium sp. TaxID=2953763 RepID=UPI00289F5893|nr:NAD(P)/FAD-dependent oxidoreductase [Hydrogenoanaerobacterium sp.]
MSQKYDVVVIGAGAAGAMAAGITAQRGLSTAVIERNARIGRKIMITGKGRCNVTNNCDNNAFINAVKVNGKFLYSAINNFSTQDTIAFFENLGVRLKTERGNRVFPVSDKSVDIVDALAKHIHVSGAKLLEGRCKALLMKDGAVAGIKLEDGTSIPCSSVIVATGGLSYPTTGSSGDGYTLAKQAGHSIVTPTPSLIPVVTNEPWCKEMMGLSLKNVTVTLIDTAKEKALYHELGEMLFTHFGVSGPLILSATSHMKQEKLRDYTIEIDLKPALSVEQLDARLLRDFAKNLNKDFLNSLSELLPRKMIPVVVELSGIDGAQKVNQITKEQRRALAELIKHLRVTPCAFRPINEAIITSGGVNVKEINPKTMESKLVKGLYFAGEVMDVDAYTGGFNLQIAFSTGVLAGTHAGEFGG